MRIAVIGNAGGGKTTISRELAALLAIPLYHVDTYQFIAGMKVRPYAETAKALSEIHEQPDWIIDGFGPLDIIEKRFEISDKIIFIDLPLWRHYLWSTKRQLWSLWSPRRELPEGCNEASLEHTIKLYKTIWRVHFRMRPELLRILSRENLKSKVVHVTSKNQLKMPFGPIRAVFKVRS